MIKIYCLTKEVYVVIIHNILSDMLDPRLLGKILSLTSVFFTLEEKSHMRSMGKERICACTLVCKSTMFFSLYIYGAEFLCPLSSSSSGLDCA